MTLNTINGMPPRVDAITGGPNLRSVWIVVTGSYNFVDVPSLEGVEIIDIDGLGISVFRKGNQLIIRNRGEEALEGDGGPAGIAPEVS